MPRVKGVCKICRSPRRADVESALGRGDKPQAVAGRFGFSRSTMYVHFKEHMGLSPEQVIAQNKQAATQAAEVVIARELDALERLRDDEDQFRRISGECEASGDTGLALRARESAGAVIERAAKLSGVIKEQNIVIINDPDVAWFRATVFRVLRRFPEANEALARELAGSLSPMALGPGDDL